MSIQPAPAAPSSRARSRRAIHHAMRFVIGVSSLGLVLVARTEQGVRAVLFGDDRDALREELHRRFPDAPLADDDALRPLAERVIAAIESPAAAPDVPIDPRGTPFQRMVWQALRDIPPGSTATYAEVAARVGQPASARAVAQACAANAIAVLVPCHRVVRSDGTLSGYRWGVDRKRELLARERLR